MRPGPVRRARAGFTLIEALIALSLVAIVVVKITLVMSSASDASAKQSAAMTLEDQARRVLDQIAYAIMSADREALFPDPESPNYSTEVTYRISLGVDSGEVIWSDEEAIGLGVRGNQVVWRQNPGMPEERRVAWCNVVRPFMEGEIPNGADDNDNGLADEEGLSFTLLRNSVTIRLCLERPQKDGSTLTEPVETVVTVRN
ncbi:MAG: type II secretion system protein [Planctomycetota bacterium]